jgi:short-subunit dehydrogenase
MADDDVVDLRDGPGGRPALAVVTGASSGIGRALAGVLAEEGFRLVIAADGAGIETAADELVAEGAEVTPARVDLATSAGVEDLAAVVDRLGGAQVLCANAGVGVAGPFVEGDLAAHLRLIDLNVRGLVQLCGLLLPNMVERGEGAVLLTSSVAATMPGPGYATYAASKAFVQSFGEALHQELHGTGVGVTALQPGPTDTRFFDRAGMDGSKADEGHKDDPERVARDGIQAMQAGDDHVVAGSFRNKVQVALANFVPQGAAAKAHGRMLDGASGDQRVT